MRCNVWEDKDQGLNTTLLEPQYCTEIQQTFISTMVNIMPSKAASHKPI